MTMAKEAMRKRKRTPRRKVRVIEGWSNLDRDLGYCQGEWILHAYPRPSKDRFERLVRVTIEEI